VSVVLAGALDGMPAVALFLLVLGGTMIPRAIGAHVALDGAFCVTILGAAWCAQLGLYQQVAWLDLVVHTVATGATAALGYLVLLRLRLTTAEDRPRTAALVTIGLGVVLALVWELLELAGHTFLDDGIFVAPVDTAGDLAAALLGSVVAAAVVARRVARGPHRGAAA